MSHILLIIHFAICAGIITLVLLQKSGGGALGIGGGQGGFMSTRGVATLLTRLTAAFGAALFINSLLLSNVMTQKEKSIFQGKDGKPVLEQPVSSQQDSQNKTETEGVNSDSKPQQNTADSFQLRETPIIKEKPQTSSSGKKHSEQ